MTMKLQESCWRRMEQGTARSGGGGLALKSSGDRSSEVRGTGGRGGGRSLGKEPSNRAASTLQKHRV